MIVADNDMKSSKTKKTNFEPPYLKIEENSGLDKDFCDRFKENFGVEVFKFSSPWQAVVGLFSFDIVSFDQWCETNMGYSTHKHGSLADFLTSKFGEKFVLDFRQNLFKSKK